MRFTGDAGRRGWTLRLCASLCVALALALGLWSGSASATAPGTNGPIVFSSYGKIYTVQPDGSGLSPVVRPEEEFKYDFYPSWSPDGLRIATSGEMREPDGYWTITGLQVFSRDGSGFEHLPIGGYIESPAWSPDGARILFIRNRELLSTTPDGAPPTHIESNAWSPAWSPDGRRIAFVRPNGPYEDTDLYTMSAAGGSAQLLLDLPGWVSSPSWSPDGSTITFTYMAREVREDPGPGELPYTYSGPNVYAVPATGGVPVQLTGSGSDQSAVWSPDGSTIVFQSDRPSSTAGPSLYLMNADGSNERQLSTSVSCLQCGPDWASLPPHTVPAAAVPAPTAKLRRGQKFSHVSVSRGRAGRAWVRFRADLTEKVTFAVRRAVPPVRASRCARKPSACILAGRERRQVREGFNRISLDGLLDEPPVQGRYWLQLKSSSGGARAGLVFRLSPRSDRQPG